MEPYVFIGKVSTGNRTFVLTTDASRIVCEKDICIKPEELAYLAAIKSEEDLKWYVFYSLDFGEKVDYAKFMNLWPIKPLEKLVSCECNGAARDYLQYHGYNLPVDTRTFS